LKNIIKSTGLGNRADVTILAALALTGIGAISVWQFKHVEPLASMISRFSAKQGLDQDEIGRIGVRAAELEASIAGQDDKALWETAGAVVAAGAPESTVQMVSELMRSGRSPKALRLGVYIAERGANRWQTASLLLRAGIEYRLGTNVDRDFAKAEKYLNDPILKTSLWAMLAAGELYLDPDNPHRDTEKAVGLIRKAAEGGLASAQKRLAELRPGS
jgi:hypothetical protein